MSLFDYRQSQEVQDRYTFYALIMAAMKQADSKNLEKLVGQWPEVWHELFCRYRVPNGILDEEREEREERGDK